MNRNRCYLCRNQVKEINIFDANFLQKFITQWAKIKLRKYTGTCNQHQKEVTKALKYARYLAILPFVRR